MAMNRNVRRWIIIFAIPVGILVVGMIGAKLYFTGERLRALVVPQLEEATNRSVTLRDISLSLFPALAISIDTLSISNPPGHEFDAPAFVSIDHASINMKILPLLRGNVEIGKVVVDRPKFYCEISPGGRKNYALSEGGETGSVVTPPSTNNLSGGFILGNVEINDGIIQWVNKKFNSRMLITGIDHSGSAAADPGAKVVLIKGATTITQFSYGDLASWYISNQPVTASEELTYDMDNDVLRFDKVNAKMRELPLVVAGTISGLMQESFMFDLSVNAPNAQMTQLLSLIPPEMLKAASGLSSTGDIDFSMTVKGVLSETVNPGVSGSFSVANGKIQYASLPKSITKINLKGTFERPEALIGKKDIGSLSIDPFSASLGTNRIGGTLSVKNFASPTIDASFNGTLNLSEVKEYYPLEPGSEFSGTMRANVSITGQPKIQQSLKAAGNIGLQDVTIKAAGSGRPIRNLNGTITFNNQLVESKRLALNIGESDLDVAFTLRNYIGIVMKDTGRSSGIPAMSLTLTSNQLRTADLTSSESAEATRQPQGSVSNKEAALVPGFDVDAKVNIKTLVTEKFTFRNAEGDLGITNGIITLKNFSLNAFDGSIKTKGMLDVRDKSKRPFDLDLQIQNVQSNQLLPKFTSFGQYLAGRFTTTTKLKGDLNDTLGLKTESLLGNGTVEITEGKLFGLPLTQKLSSFTGLEELREINFKDWTNAFSISNGRLNVKDLKVNAGQTALLLEGSQGLDGSLDYQLTLKLPESVSGRVNLPGVGGELLQYFKDKDGRINLPFAVTGTSEDPVLKFSGQDVAKQALERKKQQLLDEAKKKLNDELQKKLGEGLKKLFKRP